MNKQSQEKKHESTIEYTHLITLMDKESVRKCEGAGAPQDREGGKTVAIPNPQFPPTHSTHPPLDRASFHEAVNFSGRPHHPLRQTVHEHAPLLVLANRQIAPLGF